MAHERILIVDDETAVVHSCTRILEQHGYVVTSRSDSTAVPDLLRRETFDLLLSDIKMPKLDGLELLKIAKEIDPHLTVVLITGFGTMEDAIRAIRLGAQGFLMKPFDMAELTSVVEDSLARRTLLRDSLRLQMLLPLLEINKMLQVSGGEISLVQQVLQIAAQEIGAARLALLAPAAPDSDVQAQAADFTQIAAVPQTSDTPNVPRPALEAAIKARQPVWLLADETTVLQTSSLPNAVGAVLPLLIKGQVAGILTAQSVGNGRAAPFGQISLDLLRVLAGQLAIIIENAQLFQQAETLRVFSADIIQNMTNGLIAIDQNQRITAFNPAAANMLGRKTTHMIGQNLAQALPHAPRLVEAFQTTLLTGQALPRTEVTVQHKNGHSLPVSINTAVLGSEKEQATPLGVVGVIEDLSEIKTLEAEHRRLDRLAALGEMSAVVAHEIRNPVAGIAAGVDYLTRKAPPGSPEAEGAALIRQEVKRVNRILEDILFVARPMQLNKADHDIINILKTVQQRCQTQIEANRVQMTVHCPDRLPLLNVDNQRLEQVFSNLVINATQAMPNGGLLKIECHLETRLNNRAWVVISVTDTGPGLATEVKQRIFEPFFTTKAKGTGLGLSVARRIIEAHGGTIQAKSKPGNGTTFIVSLPVEQRTSP
ncbi:MAG: response regulator [Chloroflexi bacterium]|nr:MAG: response regulator [Chloroflexota bacterium]